MRKVLLTFGILFCVLIVKAQDGYMLYKEYSDGWIEMQVDQQFFIDINEDGVSDIVYETFYGAHSTLGSYAYPTNGWTSCSHCIVPFIGQEDAIFFDFSTPLNDTSLGYNTRCYAEYYTYGEVPPLYYKVGLRYSDGQNYYYGWAEFEEDRVDLQMKYLFHVSKTCFCSIPNYPLLWGQTSLTEGFEENESTAVASIYPNPATATVTIVGENLKQIEITNMLGQRVATHQAEGLQATIDISALPTGIYFVGITDENGKRCVRKVVKE